MSNCTIGKFSHGGGTASLICAKAQRPKGKTNK